LFERVTMRKILNIAWKGVTGVLPEVGALLGFAVLFFVGGVWRLRYE
jgi:hypothetical protein